MPAWRNPTRITLSTAPALNMNETAIPPFSLIAVAALWLVLMTAPIIVFPGVFYFGLLVFFAIAVIRSRKLPPALFLAIISAYHVILALFYSRSSESFYHTNSNEFRHVAVMMLTVWLFQRIEWTTARILLAIALLFSLTGVFTERAGFNLQKLIPDRLRDLSISNDTVYFASDVGIRRLRGLFREASALLAASTMFTTLLLTGELFSRKRATRPDYLGAGLCCFAIIAQGSIYTIVLSKSGLVIATSAMLGTFLFAVFRGTKREKKLALYGSGAAMICLAGFALIVPATLRSYLHEEFAAIPYAIHGEWQLIPDSGGLATRTQCWLLSLDILHQAPWGVSINGIQQYAYSSNWITLTPEMQNMFPAGNFGMKNTLANVIAQTGVPGLLLLGCFLYFGFTPRRALRNFGINSIAGAALAGASVAYLATCEVYYNWAIIAAASGVAAIIFRSHLPDQTTEPYLPYQTIAPQSPDPTTGPQPTDQPAEPYLADQAAEPHLPDPTTGQNTP